MGTIEDAEEWKGHIELHLTADLELILDQIIVEVF